MNDSTCQWRREIPQNRRAEIPHFILNLVTAKSPRRSDSGKSIEVELDHVL
jgi:hypothetical protein